MTPAQANLNFTEPPSACTHRQIHLAHGRPMIPVGEWRQDAGSASRERDLACPDCGAIVGVRSEQLSQGSHTDDLSARR